MLVSAVLLALAWVFPQEPPDPGAALAVTVHPEDEDLAATYEDGSVRILSARNGAVLAEMARGFPGLPWRISYSPDGQRVAGLDREGHLVIWIVPDEAGADPGGRCPLVEAMDVDAEQRESKSRGGAELLWSPTGEHVLACGPDGQFCLATKAATVVSRWRLRSGAGERHGRGRAVWQSDGSRAFFVERPYVRAIEASTGELTSGWAVLADASILAIALHPKRPILATGHSEARYRLWNLETGAAIVKGKCSDPWMPDEEDEVTSLAFSPHGNRLALTIGAGAHVFVLDADTQERLWTSEYFGFPTLEVVWSPDARGLWFASEHGNTELRYVALLGRPTPRVRAIAPVPSFGRELGAYVTSERVSVVGPAGLLRW